MGDLTDRYIAQMENDEVPRRRPAPDLRPHPSAELLARAANACRNACSDEWFQWVPQMLDRMAGGER